MNNSFILSLLTLFFLLFTALLALTKEYIADDQINMIGLFASAAIIALFLSVLIQYISQIKNDHAQGELKKESWDKIGMFNNDLPFFWGASFILSTLFSVWYLLFGYPLNAFSQIGQYNEEVNLHSAKFESTYAIADEWTLKEMGSSIYSVHCSQCHGNSGRDSTTNGVDLTRWGAEEGIVDTILNGSKGSGYIMNEMPKELLDKESAKAVAAYIMSEISTYARTSHFDLVEKGRDLYSSCVDCHGTDGKGLFGTSADLTKYGTSQSVLYLLQHGKKGHLGTMPSFKADEHKITKIQQRAVATFVSSLSKKDKK